MILKKSYIVYMKAHLQGLCVLTKVSVVCVCVRVHTWCVILKQFMLLQSEL
jgi:hypothetical protein